MAEQKWFEGLRRQIKHRCGPGWGIDERHGGVRLTRRIAAGKQHKNPRQTVQLGIPWNPAHSGDIFLVVCQIRERMENGEESLAKAFQLQQKQHGSTPTVSKSVEDEDSGWEAVIDDFIDRRQQVNRATTMRDLSCHMKRVFLSEPVQSHCTAGDLSRHNSCLSVSIVSDPLQGQQVVNR